ncbi:MAG: DUF192 domain-containing protein [Phycisphaerales bacterium]|jgi:uncharacterized membrane protein (UPF0127 family)|nr:DUF192 domain-containing protein [Phycisphaerales bacterium]
MAAFITPPLMKLSLLLLLLLVPFEMAGCSKPIVIDGFVPVEIGSRTFQLEIVADDETRNLGLGGRKHLDEDKGMIFTFPDSQVRRFVMRDCYFDIDIIYLDSAGRIIAMHHMPVEEQQAESESLYAYELRLPKYSSRFSAQYAIELVGGMLEQLNLEEGQLIKLDIEYLQSLTK